MSVMGLVKIHQDSCFFQGLASSPQTVAFSLLFEGFGLSAVWKSEDDVAANLMENTEKDSERTLMHLYAIS